MTERGSSQRKGLYIGHRSSSLSPLARLRVPFDLSLIQVADLQSAEENSSVPLFSNPLRM
jgi:hypothetical protein